MHKNKLLDLFTIQILKFYSKTRISGLIRGPSKQGKRVITSLNGKKVHYYEIFFNNSFIF
jgi:hypothetical protein